MGCALTVTMDGGRVLSVEGNSCRKGEIYAKNEVTNPKRMVTSSVPVTGGELAQVSVKTSADIPKEKIFEIMESLKGVSVKAPVSLGEVIIRDVCGTGADIIATRSVQEEGHKA